MVIVDTSVWVTALQVEASEERAEVARLLARGDAALVGMILVEILRGSRNQADYDRLHDRLFGAEFIETGQSTWLRAAQLLLDLRQRGDSIPVTDALIAAHALESGHSVYTTDNDFQRVPGLQLHVV